MIRALADSGASSRIVPENYISENLVMNDKRNKSTWITMGGQRTTVKTGLVIFSLPEIQPQETDILDVSCG